MLPTTAFHRPNQTVEPAAATEPDRVPKYSSSQCWRWHHNHEQSTSGLYPTPYTLLKRHLSLTIRCCDDVLRRFEQHLKGSTDPIMEGVLMETEKMLARGRMDLPLSLCVAALQGDDLLMVQLLKRGLDPNELDNTDRTPLVSNSCWR